MPYIDLTYIDLTYIDLTYIYLTYIEDLTYIANDYYSYIDTTLNPYLYCKCAPLVMVHYF